MGEIKNTFKFLSGNLEARDHSEDLGLNGNIILQRILGKQCEVVDWIHLAQDKDQ
jgi:hypothetical protein